MYYGEKFNSISHLIGLVLGIAATSVLLTIAILKGDVGRIVGFSIYGTMMILLYTASTLYHSFKDEKLKKIFMQLDHLSIYLMIAGTYTPVVLIVLQGTWQWAMLAGIWTLAIFGIVQELLIGHRTRKVSLVTYLLMGWLVVCAIKPMSEVLSFAAFMWLLAGGLCYTLGFVFFLFDERIKHGHGIWHLFVLAGTLAHFGFIIGYIA